ncbi:MAG: tetratricopeptide repeat protein [Gammaproteobacteria bacterium]|nr:tetratricopeptide repeat protein [Gammaproteobacteria bacterium]
MSKKNMLTHAKKKNALSLLMRNNFREARILLEEIVRSDRTDIESWLNLAIVYSRTGAVGEVERCCRQAISIRPDIVDAHFNLGVALYMQGKVDDAIQSYREALKLKPNHILALFNLGKALLTVSLLDEALSCIARVLRMKPTPADNVPSDFISTAYHAMASVLKAQGRIKEAIVYYQQTLTLNPGLTKAHSDLLLALNYDSTDAAAVFNEHVRWGQRHGHVSLQANVHNNPKVKDRPLRVGYVSPDLYRHAVTFFFEPLLANHDRSRILPFCYAEAWKQDGVTERLRSLSAQWCDTCKMNDEQLANRIRADGIDILVDLAGHTAKSRLTVFSRKPAPIQVSYLGYPNTTGLLTVDYRLTDAFADPPGQTDSFYTESLIRLPRGFLCYQPPDSAPAIGPLPSLAKGHITFGSFNNLSKMTFDTIELWSSILHGVPRSRLVLKNMSLRDIPTQQLYYREFARHGITSDRVEMHGPIWDLTDHQSVYNQIDIALDPFPYNGTTTTYEALWMGVPVITLAGKMHAGRVGISILTQLGLTEYIANDPDHYVRIAAELAGNPARLSELRASLRRRMTDSPACDAKTFARDVEEAYLMMWKKWCGTGNASDS